MLYFRSMFSMYLVFITCPTLQQKEKRRLRRRLTATTAAIFVLGGQRRWKIREMVETQIFFNWSGAGFCPSTVGDGGNVSLLRQNVSPRMTRTWAMTGWLPSAFGSIPTTQVLLTISVARPIQMAVDHPKTHVWLCFYSFLKILFFDFGWFFKLKIGSDIFSAPQISNQNAFSWNFNENQWNSIKLWSWDP